MEENPIITVTESYDMGSMTLNYGNFGNASSTAKKIFIVRNARTEEEAVDAAYKQSPSKIKDVNGIDKIPKRLASVTERCGDNTWKVEVDYGYTTNSSNSSDESYGGDDNDVPEVSFQCSASSIHVLKAIDQVLAYKSPDAPPLTDVDAIPIGWNGKVKGQSEASGIDVPFPELREQYVRVLSYNTVRSSTWRRKVASCVSCINKGKFKGWNTGEVMFLGCSYQTPQRGIEKVKVTFEFLIRTNEQNAKVCGHNIGEVLGHDYVWAVIEDAVEQNAINKKVKYIFKSRLVKAADFDILGL